MAPNKSKPTHGGKSARRKIAFDEMEENETNQDGSGKKRKIEKGKKCSKTSPRKLAKKSPKATKAKAKSVAKFVKDDQEVIFHIDDSEFMSDTELETGSTQKNGQEGESANNTLVASLNMNEENKSETTIYETAIKAQVEASLNLSSDDDKHKHRGSSTSEELIDTSDELLNISNQIDYNLNIIAE